MFAHTHTPRPVFALFGLRTGSRISRFVSLLIVAAVACTDSPVAPRSPLPIQPPVEEGWESIPGVVVTPYLLQSGERQILLAGGPTDLLHGLIGAEILAEGFIDTADGALVMHRFTVLAVGGIPALDGVLHESETGYYIETADMVELPDVPEELAGHVGKRVWLTIQNERCVEFGVLEL